MNLKSYLWKPFRHTLIPAKSKIWFTWVTHIADINNKIGKMFQETYYLPHNGIFKETESVISIVTLHAMMTMPRVKSALLVRSNGEHQVRKKTIVSSIFKIRVRRLQGYRCKSGMPFCKKSLLKLVNLIN